VERGWVVVLMTHRVVARAFSSAWWGAARSLVSVPFLVLLGNHGATLCVGVIGREWSFAWRLVLRRVGLPHSCTLPDKLDPFGSDC
jgi:hypothetical protein